MCLAAAFLAGCGIVPTTDAQLQAIKLDAGDLQLALRYAAKTSMGLGSDLTGQPKLTPSAGKAPAALAAAPRRTDLRALCPPIYHQGPFQSCTAFTVAKGLGEFLLRRRGDTTPLSAAHFFGATQRASRLAKARIAGGTDGLVKGIGDFVNGLEGVPSTWKDLLGGAKTVTGSVLELAVTDQDIVARDAGCPLAAAIATLEMGGAIAEAQGLYPEPAAWGPYATDKLARRQSRDPDPGATELKTLATFFTPGPWKLEGTTVQYDGLATALRIRRAVRVGSLPAMKASLVRGLPVAFGFSAFENLYGPDVAKTGRIPMPTARDRYLGGHAMLAVGYDDDDQTLLVRNSWGEGWGEKGYGRIPYAAFGKGLIRDGWTVAEE